MLLEENKFPTNTSNICETRQPQVDYEMICLRNVAERINIQVLELANKLGKLIIGNILSRPKAPSNSVEQELCELSREMRVIVNILDDNSEIIDAILNGLEISSFNK